MRDFVDSDLIKMATSLLEQERAIKDEDLGASTRRVLLLRASAHCLQTFAELEELSGLMSNLGRI